MRRSLIVAAVAALVAIAAVGWWQLRPSGDELQIRNTLKSLAAEFNASTTDGLGTVARAAQLGSYFSDDVIVDLGPGSGLIEGREVLIGMAARLQPRTAAFELTLDDVGVQLAEGTPEAHVTLTVSFIRRSITTGEESVDAREFALWMKKADARWRIATATAIDVLR